jgi:hypothetical protein
VRLNSADTVLAVIEQELLTQGFRVIADHYLTYATTGNLTITNADSYVVDQSKDMNAVLRDFAVRLHSRQ